MVISIIGYSGYIGSYLEKELKKNFTIKKINLRKMPDQGTKNFDNFITNITKSNVIINCAGNLNPKTKKDFFINEEFPSLLQKSNNFKKNMKFIHLSSINVLIKDFNDLYSISKRRAEQKLVKKKVIILRLPLIYRLKKGVIQNEGSMRIIYNYLNINFMPFYPMIYPGNTFQPIEIKSLTHFISKLINKKKSKYLYNLIGKEKKSLWDLFSIIATIKKKKTLKLKTNFIKKLIPKFLRNYIKKEKIFLQHILEIDSTRFKENKIKL